MAGDAAVESEELFSDALGVGVQDAVADVVGERADVSGVVVEAFEFEEQGSEVLTGGRDGDVECVFDGEAVGEVVADGGVAADAFREFVAGAVVAAFEEFLDAFVDEPEAGFHRDDGFADDGEPEVSGFDESGVDGTDGDFVDAGAFDGDERERLAGFVDGGGWAGVVAEGMPVVGPVLVVHQPAELGVASRDDAELVGEFAFEAARGERQGRQARDPGRRVVDAGDELDAGVAAGLDEQVDDADGVVVVVAGDERESVAAVGVGAELRGELVGGNVEGAARAGHRATIRAAALRRCWSGPRVMPSRPSATSALDERHHECGPRRCQCRRLLGLGGWVDGWCGRAEQDALGLVQEGCGGGGQDCEDRRG